MHLTPLVAVAVASCTWVGFAACMRCYFRFSGRVTRAKTLLVASGAACTLAQIAALAVGGRPGPGAAWAALAGYALTNGLFWWALASHGRARPAFAFVPVAPASLNRSGPYRFVRHPIYAAYLLAWLAGAVLARQAWLLLPTAWMAILYARAARQEEAAFRDTPFAAAYRAYRKQTGRFVPRWGWGAIRGECGAAPE